MATSSTVQIMGVSAVGGDGLALSSLLPGLRQRALGILPHWLPPSVPRPSVSPQTTVRRVAYDRQHEPRAAFSPPWKQLSRQPCISRCARPISSAIWWAFSFSRQLPEQAFDASYITGRLSTDTLVRPGDVHSCPGNGSRLLIQPRQWRRLVRMPFVPWRDTVPSAHSWTPPRHVYTVCLGRLPAALAPPFGLPPHLSLIWEDHGQSPQHISPILSLRAQVTRPG